MKARLDHTENVAQNTRTFWFKPEREMRYTAGQFTELRLPHEHPDERGDKRWFTISSSPSEPLVSITTKHATEIVSSFKQQLFGLQIGHEVNLADAMGDFVLPKDKTIPLVFVAAGIGVTPMRSMIKWLTDYSEQRNIHLIYAGHSEEEMPFVDLFEHAAIKLDKVIGQLNIQTIIKLVGPVNNQLFYMSGPEPLVEKLTKELPSFGVKPDKIVTDYFPGYTKI